MRLVSYSPQGQTSQPFKRGVLVENGILPLSGDFNALTEADLTGIQEQVAKAGQQNLVSLTEVNLGPPLPNPPKIICIGLNYFDHAQEANMALPESPIMFSKWSNSITGPEAEVPLDGTSTQVDYEAELVFVIGKRAYRVPEDKAYDYIAGYMCCNDLSARDLQFITPNAQWARGKSLDGFCPIGPYLATKDEIPDPHNLRIACRVNGQTLQDSNTGKMIFRIPALLSFITKGITLEPGDIVATGTPQGVGFSRKPPIFLHTGDVCEIEIEKLGVLRNTFVKR